MRIIIHETYPYPWKERDNSFREHPRQVLGNYVFASLFYVATKQKDQTTKVYFRNTNTIIIINDNCYCPSHFSLPEAMILRNLQLSENDRRELKTTIFGRDKSTRSSLTLNKVSTCNEEREERDFSGEMPQSSSHARSGGLNCDFLLGPSTNHNQSIDDNTIGEARIEELTIERCRLDLEGARVLGKALRSNISAISTIKSLKMVNLAFCDEGYDACEILLPLLEGIAEAGKRRGCLESLDFRRIPIPNSETLRSTFFSALRECKNLRSLRLVDCDIRSEDVKDLAETLRSLSPSLEYLDLSRNHIDGGGLEILLKNGMADHECLKRLVLSHNPIGDDGADHISKFFSSESRPTMTTGIESLQLIDCDLWSPGCSSLAKGIQDFDTLTELVVGGEWEQHLETVAKSLKTNVVLKHLLVVSQVCQEPEFDAYQSTMETIEYYLALNRAHRKISNDERLSFKLWPTILGEKKSDTARTRCSFRRGGSKDFRADIWFHLLRRRPELVASN